MPPRTLDSRWRTIFMFASVIALAWTLAARVFGPGDLWHQTQPKTVSYTTDIIVHGGSHWILPVERGELPATKPPLYNWLAVPAVRLFGFSSEPAHKLPSVLAMMACFAILVAIGNLIDADGEGVGWLAGLFFVVNYPIFKLGYLARPDMVLTLWLLLAWLAATNLLREDRSARRQWVLGFWGCVVLAALTKGPPALLPVAYAAVAARLVGGSWRSIHRLQWWWGVPLVLAVVGAWIYGVWRIDPEHLRQELWFNEIYGRIIGQGTEIDDGGFVRWLLELPQMTGFFMTRFAPWSLATLFFYFWLARPRESHGQRSTRMLPDPARPWLLGAAVYIALVITFFSLSTGKRADYIASAYAPGALLASWWLLRCRPFIGRAAPWLMPVAGFVALAVLTWTNVRQTGSESPMPGFAENIARFVDHADDEIERHPAPVAFIWTGHSHFKALLGYSEPDDIGEVDSLIATGEPFWIIAGRRVGHLDDFATWFRERYPERDVSLTPMARSEQVPADLQIRSALRDRGWPEQMTLYWTVPDSAHAGADSAR